jgi:hypothetical protein
VEPHKEFRDLHAPHPLLLAKANAKLAESQTVHDGTTTPAQTRAGTDEVAQVEGASTTKEGTQRRAAGGHSAANRPLPPPPPPFQFSGGTPATSILRLPAAGSVFGGYDADVERAEQNRAARDDHQRRCIAGGTTPFVVRNQCPSTGLLAPATPLGAMADADVDALKALFFSGAAREAEVRARRERLAEAAECRRKCDVHRQRQRERAAVAQEQALAGYGMAAASMTLRSSTGGAS